MKKKINIPKSWKDITLSEFLKLRKLEENKAKINTENYVFAYLSIMLNKTVEEIKLLSVTEIQNISMELMKISNTKLSVTKERIIEIEGKFYIAVLDFKDSTFGHYIDLQIFKETSEDYWEYSHKIASAIVTGKQTI